MKFNFLEKSQKKVDQQLSVLIVFILLKSFYFTKNYEIQCLLKMLRNCKLLINRDRSSFSANLFLVSCKGSLRFIPNHDFIQLQC